MRPGAGPTGWYCAVNDYIHKPCRLPRREGVNDVCTWDHTIMHEWMTKLLALQELDLRIQKLAALQSSVPLDKARSTERRRAAETLVTAAKDKVKEAEKSIKSVELDIEAVRTRMRDFQSKSAMIKNNEEYRAALTQVDACKQQIRGMEDKELAAMEALENAKREVVAAERRLAEESAKLVAGNTDLDTREKNCKEQLATMQQQRPALTEGIPAAVLRRYDRVRSNRRTDRDLRAFVPIGEKEDEGMRLTVCGGCHMKVTAQVRVNVMKGQVECCGLCGRLLYVED